MNSIITIYHTKDSHRIVDGVERLYRNLQSGPFHELPGDIPEGATIIRTIDCLPLLELLELFNKLASKYIKRPECPLGSSQDVLDQVKRKIDEWDEIYLYLYHFIELPLKKLWEELVGEKWNSSAWLDYISYEEYRGDGELAWLDRKALIAQTSQRIEDLYFKWLRITIAHLNALEYQKDLAKLVQPVLPDPPRDTSFFSYFKSPPPVPPPSPVVTPDTSKYPWTTARQKHRKTNFRNLKPSLPPTLSLSDFLSRSGNEEIKEEEEVIVTLGTRKRTGFTSVEGGI